MYKNKILLIYNENLEAWNSTSLTQGSGNGFVRKFRADVKDDIDRPKISLGIPTGSYAHPTVLSDSTTKVGFQNTNDIKDGNTVQHWIDMSITNIITALRVAVRHIRVAMVI